MLTRILHCLLLSLLCLGPAWPAAAARDEVLVLSGLPEDYDRDLMVALRRQLKNPDGSALASVERIALQEDADPARLQTKVAHILGLRPWKLVVATDTWTALLLRQNGTRLPVLFRVADNPVGLCLVHSLRHPSTNATGFAGFTWSEGKMIETLQLAYPGIEQVIMVTEGQDPAELTDCPNAQSLPKCQPGYVDNLSEQDLLLRSFTGTGPVRQASRRLPRPLRMLRLCTDADTAQLSRWLPANPPGRSPRVAVVVPYHGLLYSNGPSLVGQLRELRLPAIYAARSFLPMGALMTLSSVSDPPGEAAGTELARRILAGESPADLPVHRPEGLALTVNLHVARELGFVPSKTVLRAADRLIR